MSDSNILKAPAGFERGGRLRTSMASVEWAASRISAPFRLLPDFLIIGAQKCGTTSLCSHLFSHPQVLPSRRKEIHFFDAPEFGHGLGWYKAHFASERAARARSRQLGREALTGEASPYYLAYPHAPRRVVEALPDVKLIVMLRNPVDRALSHYNHQVRLNREPLSFEEAVEAEPERLGGELERMLTDETYYSHRYWAYSYLARGRYAEQLQRWLQRFPRDRLLAISSEQFFESPHSEYQRVLDFLGLARIDLGSYRKQNTGTYDGMDSGLRERLEAYFEPHNQRLYELVERDFGW